MISRVFYQPLEKMKTQLQDLSEDKLGEYIAQLYKAREEGPKKVSRSKKTGAPKGGKSASSMHKLKELLDTLPEEERQSFLRGLENSE